MNVAIRTDASTLIGSGHLMRCLTLADHLRSAGAEVLFVAREHPGHLCDAIAERGFSVVRLPAPEITASATERHDYRSWLAVPWEQDARETGAALEEADRKWSWLVVDHYGLDHRWESAVRPHGARIMVIDDLANRKHDCELLLDQNFYLDLEGRYDSLTPGGCRHLLGPSDALLRTQFYECERQMSPRDGTVRHVLVFYGGVDATGETMKTMRALDGFRQGNLTADVVVGPSNREADKIGALCDWSDRFVCHDRVENMAELMARADISFGGGGTTTWERCYLGLPTATVEVADNQQVMLEALATRQAIWHMGRHDRVTEQNIVERLEFALANPRAVRQTGMNARAIMGDHVAGVGCPTVEARLNYS